MASWSNEFCRIISLNIDKIDVIISYGLGPVSMSVISQHQLAVVLRLKDLLGCPLMAYDPIFDQDDKTILSMAGVSLCEYPIPENMKGKRILLFMPHCEVPVHLNLNLEEYGDDLEHILLFGNKQKSDQFSGFDVRIQKVNVEYPRADVFNDCFLHTFTVTE